MAGVPGKITGKYEPNRAVGSDFFVISGQCAIQQLHSDENASRVIDNLRVGIFEAFGRRENGDGATRPGARYGRRWTYEIVGNLKWAFGPRSCVCFVAHALGTPDRGQRHQQHSD
jgi:hypothetical protein